MPAPTTRRAQLWGQASSLPFRVVHVSMAIVVKRGFEVHNVR